MKTLGRVALVAAVLAMSSPAMADEKVVDEVAMLDGGPADQVLQAVEIERHEAGAVQVSEELGAAVAVDRCGEVLEGPVPGHPGGGALQATFLDAPLLNPTGETRRALRAPNLRMNRTPFAVSSRSKPWRSTSTASPPTHSPPLAR